MNILNNIKKTFPNLALFTLSFELDNVLFDCDSVLDLGCGDNSPLGFIKKKKYSVGVDGFKKSIQISKSKNIHDKYLHKDILKIKNDLPKKSFDAVIALDVIEHLEKKEGFKLIRLMEHFAVKKVILLTPNGFVNQTGEENGLQEHLSGWNVSDFRKLGFKVYGRYGIKSLRSEKAELKYRPKILWGFISEFSNLLYSRTNPERAYSLLAIKEL